ncbi:hypothetical protein OO006_11330 [Prosthecochloris sp. SCSIO W1101]|uniref:hypothetical protein n=1 Tax=Prosthecochloris sp. SCSIO W1101 TaxID=2992242 RepID=UPI00223CFFA3|nr:hypothetical protein [Prosthecochloris sp. SCSIO W1101]UZJ40933.1 hypothetical protein OO006_11330 [Prosthecochloris sp. SCSIO W1101]
MTSPKEATLNTVTVYGALMTEANIVEETGSYALIMSCNTRGCLKSTASRLSVTMHVFPVESHAALDATSILAFFGRWIPGSRFACPRMTGKGVSWRT